MNEQEQEFDFTSWAEWASQFKLPSTDFESFTWRRRFEQLQIDNQLAEDYRNVIFDL
jgi:hypothetical protein